MFLISMRQLIGDLWEQEEVLDGLLENDGTNLPILSRIYSMKDELEINLLTGRRVNASTIDSDPNNGYSNCSCSY